MSVRQALPYEENRITDAVFLHARHLGRPKKKGVEPAIICYFFEDQLVGAGGS